MKHLPRALCLGLWLLSATSQADDKQIIIQKFLFSPDDLTVRAGTKVTWVNHDETVHSVAEKNKTFHSGGLDTNDSYSFTLTTPGT